MVTSNRAGRYVEQLAGDKAFIPNSTKPWHSHGSRDVGASFPSDRTLGRLNGSTNALPNPDLLTKTS